MLEVESADGSAAGFVKGTTDWAEDEGEESSGEGEALAGMVNDVRVFWDVKIGLARLCDVLSRCCESTVVRRPVAEASWDLELLRLALTLVTGAEDNVTEDSFFDAAEEVDEPPALLFLDNPTSTGGRLCGDNSSATPGVPENLLLLVFLRLVNRSMCRVVEAEEVGELLMLLSVEGAAFPEDDEPITFFGNEPGGPLFRCFCFAPVVGGIFTSSKCVTYNLLSRLPFLTPTYKNMVVHVHTGRQHVE